MNFYKSPRNEFLKNSAKSEISRNNLKCLRCAALPQASLAMYVFTYGEGHQQWVLPNATILGCSFGFLPSSCLLQTVHHVPSHIAHVDRHNTHY